MRYGTHPIAILCYMVNTRAYIQVGSWRSKEHDEKTVNCLSLKRIEEIRTQCGSDVEV